MKCFRENQNTQSRTCISSWGQTCPWIRGEEVGEGEDMRRRSGEGWFPQLLSEDAKLRNRLWILLKSFKRNYQEIENQMHKIQITGWEKVKQPREQQMVGRRGGDNIGYFSECFWCAQHWQKTITGQINEAGLAQPCFMDREACGTKWLGYQGHTAHQQWWLQLPFKGQASGRQAGEPSRFSVLYPESFQFFPNWAHTVFL